VKKGYPISTVPLGALVETPDELVARCHVLQAEMLEWLGHVPVDPLPARYDGTLGSLMRVFQSHEDSPLKGKRQDTIAYYTWFCRLVEQTVGKRRVDELMGPDFRRWHALFAAPIEPGQPLRLRRAQSAMTTIRRAVSFGVELRFDGCADLRAILSAMRFETPSERKTVLEYGQAVAIIAKAHATGRPSVALAQAIAFDLTLRQRDIIGEWTVNADPNAGGITDSRFRWDRGLLWSDIDARGVLKKATSKSNGKKIVEFDLRRYPLVSAELARIPLEQRIGPMVIDEKAGRPYRKRHFQTLWRKIATAAGVPEHVWQMDSRAGGLTESTDAGADLETARHQAGHSNVKTTARYSRGSLEKTSKVADLRSAHRAANSAEEA
jgi:hypothetical protein